MTGTAPLPEALAERLAFLQLDSESLDRVRSLEAGVLRHLGPALDRFYERLAGQPDVAEFFSGSEQAERAKSAQLRHWSAIAGGQLDADYFESSNRIGRRHAQIGLAPNWYIGGYGLIAETIIKGLLTDFFDAQAAKPRGLFARRDEAAERQEVAEFGEAVAALIKSVMVDVDIAVTTYFDRLTAVAAEQQKASSDKIALAVTSVGEVLRQVAEGDLTARVTAALDPELEQIKVDTNAVADRLLAVMTRLRGASTALRTATGDILSGTTDLSDRTVRQAASVEQTSASLQQITGMVASNAERASAAEERMAAVVDLAGVGGREMSDATDAMQRINESTARITSITGLIDDIAFQTNLLALNASVEAARAGEAGKGFAVVAVEVRRLAQSAAAASQEIKSLIDASAGEVSSGTGLVTSAGETLRHILEEIRQCSELTRAIASSSREQAQAIHEINTAIREIDAGTQHNAALVEETNAAIEQTEQQAAELDGIVEMFRTEPRRPERRATAA